MSTNQVSFQIVKSGKGGLKVVRTTVGRSVRVYVSRTGSFAQDESACMRYLHRVKVNGMGPAFASVEERENMRAAALAISLQEQKRGERAAYEPFACVECGEPVAIEDACDEQCDLHIDCEAENRQRRADAAVDRLIDAAMDRHFGAEV